MAQQIDIGILTIRDDEFRAVLNAFPEEFGDGIYRGKNREYAFRQASAGKAGRYSLAIVRQPEQGNGEAQEAARDLLEDFEPSLLLVVGIAGGLPSDDLTLGDVVLSTRINDYSVEARKEGSEPTYAMTGGPIAKQVLAGIANLAAREKDLGDWAASLSAKPAVNWTRRGQLYGPEEWQKELKEKLRIHYGKPAAPRAPIFMAGPIASSDRLIKDPRVLFPWIQTARNLLAVEMESGGVYRAARDRCPMLAIRALSDIIGLKRANEWTKYAAEAAAAFACAYLQTCPVALRSRDNYSPMSNTAPLKTLNALSITGGYVEAGNIVVGEQHIHHNTTSAQLDVLEQLVDNGLFDTAKEQLDALERSSWASMTPTEKSRHRKMQGRILVRRGQKVAGAACFVEAADFVPGDEKAQVLRVNALMLRDDFEGAHELAGKLVMQYPSLVSAKAWWITSAPDSARSDDLLAKPWDGVDPEIASALAGRLLSENRAKEALEVLQRAHTPGVKLPYWNTYSVALLKYQEQLGGEKGPPELLAEALPALEKTYKLWTGDGDAFKQGKIRVLLNMGYVHRLRGDLDEEWRVLREACELDPSHRDVRTRMATVLMDRGRYEEAIAIFEALLNDGPDHVPFLLGVALAKRNVEGDMERAAELFEQTVKLVNPSEPVLRLDGAEALVKISRKMKQWDRALAACRDLSAVLGGFRSAELEAGIHLERGDSAAANRVLIELASSEMTEDQRRTLGVLLQKAGENERAYALLEPVARRNEWSAATAALITAAQATDRNESTIRICRQLRESGITRSSIVEAEAVALQRRGELAAAIAVVEQGLTSNEDPFLRLRLSILGVASNRPELIEKDPARLPKPGDGDPSVAVMVVGVLRAAGEHELAIRYAYDAYRANRSDADGWRAIIDAFMPMFGPANHVEPSAEPSAVAVGAAVLVREGKNRRWIIVEESEPEAEHDELPPDSPLVGAMLGKKVGDSFELPRGSAPPRVYCIEEIRSKYAKAYQRCLDQWEEQFPNVPGPVMLEVPENLEEDIEEFTKQLLPMLEERARRVEELERLYQNNPVTFQMLARGLGGSVFSAMGYLIAATEIDVRCTRAQPDETRLALATLEGRQKVILETSALSTLLLLEESELLSDGLRGRIAIAQSTLDELRVHRRKVETRSCDYMSARDGRLALGEIDKESRSKYLNAIDDLLGKAAECEVFHEKNHDHLTPDEWDRLVNIGGAGAVESLHRAMRTGEPVWCDDMVLALVAHERGVRVVWTQLMCHHLLLGSAMDAERAHRISAKLVGWRFVKTNTTPGIYLEAARLATWNPDHWPLRQHLRLFEVEPWDDGSVGALAANVLRYWWRHGPSDAVANAVTVALLERVAARTNGPALLRALDGVLERAFGVDVLSYQRARAAMDAWRRARPLLWVP